MVGILTSMLFAESSFVILCFVGSILEQREKCFLGPFGVKCTPRPDFRLRAAVNGPPQTLFQGGRPGPESIRSLREAS